MTDSMFSETNASQRIDKWLWYARLTKTRSLACRIVEAGHVRVNRQRVLKASAPVKRGDIITATLNNRVVVIEVRDLGERRGPAPEAHALYVVVNTGAPPADGPGETIGASTTMPR